MLCAKKMKGKDRLYIGAKKADKKLVKLFKTTKKYK